MHLHIHKYGKGFPLVFFHGWGFDSQVWSALIPFLATDFQLILVDLPGFGHTSMMDWDFFKHGLIKQLPQQFALIGWSMGGLYATRLAVEHPERINFLINVTSSPRFLCDDFWPGISSEVFQTFYEKLTDNASQTLKEFLKIQSLTKNEKRHLLPVETSLEGLSAGLKVLESWDLRQELKQFHKPSCFMFARFDSIVPINTMKSMQVAYPHFHYVLFNKAAHMPFVSHNDLFIKEIKEFIQ